MLQKHFSEENYYLLERYNESWKHDYHFKSDLGNIPHACIHQADTGVMKWFLKPNTTGKQQKPRGRKQHPKLFALASLGGPSSEEAKGST